MTLAKANLQDMLGVLANEWTRFHADNWAANEALKAKIEENKTVGCSAWPTNRYYDLKFGDYNSWAGTQPDLWWKSAIAGSLWLRLVVRQKINWKADNVNMFARQLKAESKFSDLVAYLDYKLPPAD